MKTVNVLVAGVTHPVKIQATTSVANILNELNLKGHKLSKTADGTQYFGESVQIFNDTPDGTTLYAMPTTV